MDEKFIVKTKKFNTWIRSELRFLPEGISIVNEYKSILIKYNELTGLNLDDNLFLTLVYTKMTPSGKFFGNEQIECNETIIKEIKKRTKTKITKVQNPKNGLLRDSVILVGKCRYGFNQDEYQFYLTHKKIILIMYSHASHAHASLLKLFKHAFIVDTPAVVLMLFSREWSINIRTPKKSDSNL